MGFHRAVITRACLLTGQMHLKCIFGIQLTYRRIPRKLSASRS